MRKFLSSRARGNRLLEPFLDVVELTRRDRVDVNRRAREVGEDEDHIEVFESILNSFEMSDFDVGEREDEEGGFGEVDEGFGRRLEEDVGSERNSAEAKLCKTQRKLDRIYILVPRYSPRKGISTSTRPPD